VTRRIRVVLAEDQGMLRGALATLLSIEPDMEVLGSFSDGEQALQAVGKHRPDVLAPTSRCQR
jgi:two-component system, NarL family, response regulator DesR